MNAPLLSGIIFAWALAKVALGSFFVQAYVYRRDSEYLLFGILCCTLALHSLGIGFIYYGNSVEHWLWAARLAHSGAIASAAVNLHFVLRYAEVRRSTQIAMVLYAVAILFSINNLAGAWWEGSPRFASWRVLGFEMSHVLASPKPMAQIFYGVATVELLTAVWVLWRFYRAGQLEAFRPLIGSAVVAGAGINDILLTIGWVESVYLIPHGFLIYAAAMASTLPERYRVAAGALEATESDLRERTEELRTSYAELQVIQDELSSKAQLAQIGELAAAIAHEVRNPLAIIVNACASLKRAQITEKDQEMLLGIVEEEAARLNRLVSDLLRFARPVKLKRSEVLLAEILQRAESRVNENYKINMDIENDPRVITIWADPSLLPLVFENLVDNACQSMRSGGTVNISARYRSLTSGDFVQVEIKDTGQGMEESVRARSTDPFFTTRPSGTGLGLPIVGRIVEAHGGQLSIESQLGSGTTVSVLIPVQAPTIRGITNSNSIEKQLEALAKPAREN